MAIFYDIHTTVDLANLSHNPPFVGIPEVREVQATILKPWLNFQRGWSSNPRFGDIVRFLLQADSFTHELFPLGGYILYDDGHLNWAFRWECFAPWSVDKDGNPIRYIFYCQRWEFEDSKAVRLERRGSLPYDTRRVGSVQEKGDSYASSRK